jgi:hypothetical protein
MARYNDPIESLASALRGEKKATPENYLRQVAIAPQVNIHTERLIRGRTVGEIVRQKKADHDLVQMFLRASLTTGVE